MAIENKEKRGKGRPRKSEEQKAIEKAQRAKKAKSFSVRDLPNDYRAKIELIAKYNERDFSGEVRIILREYIEKNKHILKLAVANKNDLFSN